MFSIACHCAATAIMFSIGAADAQPITRTAAAPAAAPTGRDSFPLQPAEHGGQWDFVGLPWVSSAAGDWTPPLTPGNWSEAPEHSIADDGNFAFYIGRTFTTFTAEFEFRMLSPWAGAGFVFGAGADAGTASTKNGTTSFYLLEFPSTGQQARAEHAWLTLSSVDAATGVRSAHYLHQLGGVTSQNGFAHRLRLTLDARGLLSAWVDGRPVPPFLLGRAAVARPGCVGYSSYNVLGTGCRAAFRRGTIVITARNNASDVGGVVPGDAAAARRSPLSR